MKLLVILLSLLSERYLVHAVSAYRFSWFDAYFSALYSKLPKTGIFSQPYVILALVILPPVLILTLFLFLFCHVLWGLIYFLINLGVFYYCLGTENPFYPIREEGDNPDSETSAGHYFFDVNHQLFAVIFWFVLAGAPGVLIYRLLHLSAQKDPAQNAAQKIIDLLDWVSSRVTLLLYLLVGNFQQGFQYYRRMFFSAPANNRMLLTEGGLLAAKTQQQAVVTLPYAQTLVEQALVVFLVLIAFFTLAAWL